MVAATVASAGTSFLDASVASSGGVCTGLAGNSGDGYVIIFPL